MGAKDIEEKVLEDYNDVFADIINVLLFNGEEKVGENELENTKDKSSFKDIDGVIREQERDTAKWWRRAKIRIALFGLENQTNADPNMNLRLFSYDGAAYKSQYESGELYPVVTLVLYFGYKQRWNQPKTLFETIEIPEILKPYVNDYKMNLFEIAWLTDEQVKMFKSDFGIVADYFVQMRKNNDYEPSREQIRHVDAMLKMMKVLTEDNRFELKQNEREDVVNMSEVLDRIEAKGRQEGRQEGIREGRREGIREGRREGIREGRVQALYYDAEFTIEEIAEKLDLTEDKIREILEAGDE